MQAPFPLTNAVNQVTALPTASIHGKPCCWQSSLHMRIQVRNYAVMPERSRGQ
jgi:hypothetical protein